MRFFLLYAVYGIIAVALEATWLARIPLAEVKLDLVILAVIALAFTEEWRRALPVVLFLGAIVDAMSFAPLGMTVFSYVVLYLVMRLLIAKVAFQADFGRFFWIAALSFGEKVVSGMLVLLWTGSGTMLQYWLQRAFPQAILDAVVGFLFVPCLIWYGGLTWEKITRPEGLVVK